MDFSTKLDDLQQRAADAKATAQAAVSESREQLRQRIDQARVDVDLAAKDTRQQVGEVAASARGTWAQMKADVRICRWTARLASRGLAARRLGRRLEREAVE